MKKILVVNQFNSDNLGDKLLNDMLCKNLKKMGFQVSNQGFAQQIEQPLIYKTSKSLKDQMVSMIKKGLPVGLKFKLNYKRKLKRCFRQIQTQTFDALLVGGGQLLKHNSVFIYCLKAWIDKAEQLGIPVIIYGVGVDSSLSRKEIVHYKEAIQKARYICCRDIKSANLFKAFFDLDVAVAPDIAFTLNINMRKQKRNTIMVQPYHYLTAQKHFGTYSNKKEYYISLTRILSEKCRENPDSQIVLTATTSVDAFECEEFRKYLQSTKYKDIKIIQIQQYSDLIDLLCYSNTIITGRMHAMIMGMICGTQVEPILISDKIKDFTNDYLQKDTDIKLISEQAYWGLQQAVNAVIKSVDCY